MFVNKESEAMDNGLNSMDNDVINVILLGTVPARGSNFARPKSLMQDSVQLGVQLSRFDGNCHGNAYNYGYFIQ